MVKGVKKEEFYMDQFPKKKVDPKPSDRIEGTAILLDGEGTYPKDVIIFDRFGRVRKYLLKKTPKGNYLLI